MTTARAAPQLPGPSSDLQLVEAGGVTRYAQLAMALRHRIVSGEWPVGTRLPTVEQLAQESGLAKVTVRQAFARLAAEGLIVSQRGRGTHVQAVPTGPGRGLRSAINNMMVGASDLEIQVLRKTADLALPASLAREGLPAERYVRLVKLHLHDGLPFALMDLYVVTDAFRKFARGAERRFKVAYLLRQALGDRLGPMRQTVTVEPAGAALAQHLAYSFAAPVVRIVRTMRDTAGRILYLGQFWYRGDRFVLEMEMPVDMIYGNPAVAVPDSRRATSPWPPLPEDLE